MSDFFNSSQMLRYKS